MDETGNVIIEMEAALIGAALSAPADIVPALAPILRPEFFLSETHGSVFGAMVERHAKGAPANSHGLASYFNASWNTPINGAGGRTVGQYIAGLMGMAVPVMQIRAYAEEVRSSWGIRALASAAGDAQQNGAPDERLAAFFSRADEIRAALADITGTREAAGDTARALLVKVNDRMQGKGCNIGASTGFARIDGLIGGYIPGQLVVVAGRPGMGKTTVATSSAWQCAKNGHGVAFFSLEMGRDDMAARLLADVSFKREAGIPYSAIKAGLNLTETQFGRLCDAQSTLDALPLDMDYAGRLSAPEIGARIAAARKRLARKGQELRVAFVDYLKMVSASDRYRGNRVQEVGEITAGLREVAKREGVCIVLLAQLNRGSEATEDKRPQLQHLRDSGDIEADADVVLFAYRPAYYIRTSAKYLDGDPAAIDDYERQKNALELIAAKNRNGATMAETLFVDIASSAVREVRP